MEVMAYTPSLGDPTTKVLPASDICREPDHIPAGHPRKSFGTDTQCSDSTDSSSDAINASGSSYSAARWHGEDDTTDDQGDGWQLVGSKSSVKSQLSRSSGSTDGAAKPAVCGRCGIKGHVAVSCKQPHCSRCNHWWHTEDECSKACSVCGSLDHQVCGSSLCKSYKCRECGLYGHVYAECPNIKCNLCREIGHKALDCPHIVCNICKQKGHKAVHCANPRGTAAAVAAAGASKPAAAADPQHLHVVTPAAAHLQHCSSSCSSTASPMSAVSPAAVSSTSTLVETPTSASPAAQPEVPLVQQSQHTGNVAEQQLQQQNRSQLLGQLYKIAPDAAISYIEDSHKLQLLFSIEPQYMMQLLQELSEYSPVKQRLLLDAAVANARRQLQEQHLQQRQHQMPATPDFLQSQQQNGVVSLLGTAPAAAANPVNTGHDVTTDGTQGIKPGDLAPQHAKQLVALFGDMLPSRWQQLPSWRQLEARLSFPDGNYVQRRLQFREKRRQLQLLTVQMRAAAAGKQHAAPSRPAVAATAQGPAGQHGPRIVPLTPTALPAAVGASSEPGTPTQQQQQPVGKPAWTPCSYAAALAGNKLAAAVATSGSPAEEHLDSPTAISSAAHEQSPAVNAAADSEVAVCSRCGMLGHSSHSCVQPRCSKCQLWWHTELQCSSACQFCGSLDHSGDAEQPSSCKSFRCKFCKMFGHTASICPQLQLHQRHLQRQGSSLGSSSGNGQLQAPRSPLPQVSGINSYVGGSPCPPDSPGLGQQGVKPKDLLPEHAQALQDEFPNALPSGWQQMGSWRMVEERLRVVAVEGAVFSKRRQMWRDRRKHYQQLTAQALVAAAARSSAAAGPVVMPASDSSHSNSNGEAELPRAVQEDSSTRQAAGEATHNGLPPPPSPGQQKQASGFTPGTVQPANVQQPTHGRAETPTTAGVQQQQPTQQEQLEPVYVPEWQQNQGSLFSLADPVTSGQPLAAGITSGSIFSSGTHFCSSPVPAQTPSVVLSPLGDPLRLSGVSTPAAASGSTSSVVTPASHPAVRRLHTCVQGVGALTGSYLSPVVSMPCSTSLCTSVSLMPGMAAPGMLSGSSSGMSSRAGYGGNMILGDSRAYSPVHMPPGMRSPLGYPAQPPSSPMGAHSCAVATAAAANGGIIGHQLQGIHPQLLAQRQNQLQQQLMMHLPVSPYPRPIDQSATSVSPNYQQQHLLMQMQQQQAAQQRRQRPCRMDQPLFQQRRQSPSKQQVQLPGAVSMEELADTGELDDKLGVLGVLGLQ